MVLLCLGNAVCSSRKCNFRCERCWSCMITCKLLCVLYVAVASVLVLSGGSNGSVRALPDVSVLYIRAATTVSDLLVSLAFA